MRVSLDKIGPDGVDLDEPVTGAWVNESLGSGSPFECRADGRLTVHLDRVEDTILVRGRVALALSAACSRCLGETELAVDKPISIALLPKGQEPQPGPDGELSADDMGVASYEDKEIDLSSIVHDEVLLGLPMSPICSEGCAGLCPHCGNNLNEGPCACEVQPDPHWEALSQIKVD